MMLAVMATRAAYLVDPLSTGLVLGLMKVVVACLAFWLLYVAQLQWRSCAGHRAPHGTGSTDEAALSAKAGQRSARDPSKIWRGLRVRGRLCRSRA